jgi:hypothetical protein
VPQNLARVAAGPFLNASLGLIERYPGLPQREELQKCIWDRRILGRRTHRRGLSAAIVSGTSMVDQAIYDGEVLL